MNLLRSNFVYIITWLAIATVTIITLHPGLSGGFFFDDESNIVRNEAIKINKLSFDTLLQSTSGPVAGPLGRPVSVASFAVTYSFFGLDPYAFKAVNLALHILNGLLVAWLIALLLKLFKADISPKERTWLSIWISAVWLLHPINILPVMLAVQRMTLLSGMFLLLAFICHIKASLSSGNSRWALYIAAWLFFWPLAIFSKETGLLLPGYVFLLALFLPTQPAKKNWALAFSLFLLGIIVLAMQSFLGWDWLKHAYMMRSFSLTERLMTEARVLWFYVSQIVLPNFSQFAIYMDYFSVSRSPLNPPTTLISILGWVFVCVAMFFYRARLPLLCFAIAWFLIGHSLESSFLPLEIAHEYRNYLPSIGLILGIGYLGTKALGRLTLDYVKTTITVVAIFPLLILVLFSSLRAEQLSNPLLSAQIEAARHPLSARANYSAALSLFQSGYGDISNPIGGQQIRYYFEQAGKVDHTFKYGYLGLITWSCASGRKIDDEWINTLAYRLHSTPFSPSDRELPNEILKVLLNIPTCLSREKSLEFFITGSENPRINPSLKAKFLEAASDYELLVSLDPLSARNLLSKAAAAWPQSIQLKNKLENFRALEHLE